MGKERPDTEPEKVAELVRHHLLCVAQHVPSKGSFATQALPQYIRHCHYIVIQQIAASPNIITRVPKPDAQYASQHIASKPVADSSRTPLPPGRGTPQNSKPADAAMSRPGVATRIPNALFGSAPHIIKAVPRQVSSRAASWLSKPAQQVQLSELGHNSKATFGSAVQQQPAAGSASLSAALLPGSKAATGPVSAALLPGSAAAAGVPLLPTGKAAGQEIATPLLSTGTAAAAGPDVQSVTGAASAPLVPSGQAAATTVNAAAVSNGIATSAATVAPLLPAGKAVTAAPTAPLFPTGKAAATTHLLPTGKAATTAPLLPGSKSAVPSFMRPCSKPWGVNKGGRAGGLSKTLGVPRGAKGSRGTGVAQQEKVAKTGEQACNSLLLICFSSDSLGSPVKHLASHQIDAARRSLSFLFIFLLLAYGQVVFPPICLGCIYVNVTAWRAMLLMFL